MKDATFFIGVILVVAIGLVGGFRTGQERTGNELCARYGARYLDGKCVLVVEIKP